MAGELIVAGQISFAKSGAGISKTFPTTYFDVAGTSGIQNVIALAITDETIALGDISTIGWVYFKNLDGTNYISVGSDGTLYPIKLKPGEFCLCRWNAAAIHAKANTAPCNVEYIIIPD